MRIFPIQGLLIKNREYISVPIPGYSIAELNNIFEIRQGENLNHILAESIVFIDKKYLNKYIEESVYKKIINESPQVDTFALANNKWNKWSEIYYLKIALSIIYISNRMSLEDLNYQAHLDNHASIYANLEEDFKMQFINFINQSHNFINKSEVMYGFFNKNVIESTICDIKIGNSPFTNNDFDLTVLSYCTLDDEPEFITKLPYQNRTLIVTEDISANILKIFNVLKEGSKISRKLNSVFNLLYSTLPHQNMDMVITTYATILETLLLSDNEDKQRKKVSVRSACLVANETSYKMKSYIATLIYHFYEYRNAIIHDGKSHIQLRLEEDVVFNRVVSLTQHLIYSVIKEIILNNITEIRDIKLLVTNNCKADNLDNGFDYISDKIEIIYVE